MDLYPSQVLLYQCLSEEEVAVAVAVAVAEAAAEAAVVGDLTGGLLVIWARQTG